MVTCSGALVLPYWTIPAINLPFGEKLDVFGVLSAAGVAIGALLAARAARTIAPGDDTPLRDVAPTAIIVGLIGAHLLHVLGYHPELLEKDGVLGLLRIWDGLSSMGGVLGALGGIIWWFRRHKVPLGPYWNALALGTAPGWAVARIGCFFVHDHPGVRSDFPLAVAYPGGARHDLGLYDFFVLAAIAGVLWLMARKPQPEGRLMGVLALSYSVCRFFLDFLRASDLSFVDKRYLGLTPAQFIVMGLAAIGVRLLLNSRGQPSQVLVPPASGAS
jgi:phosphatidylglycerol---prolipoprotein diacylglyceryl transferase